MPTPAPLPTPRPVRTRAGAAYVERVNLAIDYIVQRIGEPRARLRLEEVARAAGDGGLSPCHFHRIFHALMEETLADFVRRLRLEKAVAMMCHASAGRRVPLAHVAMACGFASPSDFSRCFKHRFGAPPSAFNSKAWRESHRAELQALVDRSVPVAGDLHLKRLPRPPLEKNPDSFSVRIRDLPPRNVAYIRVRNPYRGDAVAKATHRLIAWAEHRGVADSQWLGYQWDNPEITRLEDCVYHIAVELPQTKPETNGRDREIGRLRFPAMVVAQVEVRGGLDLELRALQWLYSVWLPRSGYIPDDHPCFEAFVGRPPSPTAAKFHLHAQLPVKLFRRRSRV